MSTFMTSHDSVESFMSTFMTHLKQFGPGGLGTCQDPKEHCDPKRIRCAMTFKRHSSPETVILETPPFVLKKFHGLSDNA